MEIAPFTTDRGWGWQANLGLIVLQTDETLEMEMRGFIDQDGIAVYHSRIPSAPEVTPASLSDMRHDLMAATRLLPPSIPFKVIGYGCTSASAVLGEEMVTQLVQQVQPAAQVTNPASAAIKALIALNSQRVALLTPYTEEVSAILRVMFAQAGVEIVSLLSFNEANDTQVARISESSILQAIITCAQLAECDAVFVSCTNLRVARVIALAEAQIGIPVVSSNQALAWDMLRLAKVELDTLLPQRLFDLVLPTLD